MIRMVQSKSAGHAKAYFSDALSKSDYYVSDQELAGCWQGKLAFRLGLKDTVTQADFFALCENRKPGSAENLTPVTREDRTVGYDINFHCPKSVSLIHSFAEDDHVLTVFQESVTETMKLIEADAMTRVRMGGQHRDRVTQELAWAHFVHQTARPVAGKAPDPHLHSHCFVFNATWDETEGRIKATQFREINRDMPYYQAVFHKKLADKLILHGYTIRRTAKSFEVEGLPQRALALFSKRTDEIGRIAKERGITDPEALGELGARTRSKKQKGLRMEELRGLWRTQMDVEMKPEDWQKTTRLASLENRTDLTAQDCIDYAIQYCFERASVISERRLLAIAYRHSLGCSNISLDDIMRKFAEDGRILRVEDRQRPMCTTREVLREEKNMVMLARKGFGRFAPLYTEAPELTLSGQQAEAVTHVLTTRNQVSIVRGVAGSGKTTLMTEAALKIRQAGKKLFVVAPSTQSSRGVLRSQGFFEADTVARLLLDKEMQQKLRGQVLWVDEAGLLGTKAMTALLKIVTEEKARLVLAGDTRQHSSVVRGDALRILNTVAGITSAEVNKIYRQQKEDYRTVVEDLAQGRVKEAFIRLDQMGAVKEIAPMDIKQQLVADYIMAIRQKKDVLVICPTHAQGDDLTHDIREGLCAKRLLGRKELHTMQFVNLNLTDAEKSDVRQLQVNHVIVFNQNAPGFKRGSEWIVNKIENGKVHLLHHSGTRAYLPFDKSGRYDVYTMRSIQIAKGDKVMVTRNGFDLDKKRLDNGQMLAVVAVNKFGRIKLRGQNGTTYTLHSSFGHLSYAHCITSHASQSKTVDEVFIYQPAATFPATNLKQLYVSVSRGRDMAHLYTDDKEALLEHAKDLAVRPSALELVSKRHKYAALQQRYDTQSLQKQFPLNPKPRTRGHEPER